MHNFVSIITPTFNRAYILKNPIQSLLDQSYDRWELLIVDDGSTDTTKELVEGYKDPRIKYFYQKNQGQSAARNKGLEEAQGEWIAYLDSDNELYPEYLTSMIKDLENNRNAFFALPQAHRTMELYQDKVLVETVDDSSDFPEELTVKDIVHRKLHADMNGFIHNRKIIEAGIRFDPNIIRMEDWDFMMTICEKFPENFLYVKKKLYNYHQRFGMDGVVENTTPRQWAEMFEYIYQKHKDDVLMKDQEWYPQRVEKWNKYADDYEKGLIDNPNLKVFKSLS